MTAIKMYDEEDKLFYTEEFTYEGDRRVQRTIIKETETTKVDYQYNEEGRLSSEILYTPKGKPYATIQYTYELYPN